MSSWNDTRIDILKRLWPDRKLTTRVIARRLGGVTRNAVIGKAHRLGLPPKRRPKVYLRRESEAA